MPAAATVRGHGRLQESCEWAGLTAVANLAFKKGLRSQQAMEAMDDTEVKAMPLLLASQHERASHTLKWRVRCHLGTI